jgi:hypothetical protein
VYSIVDDTAQCPAEGSIRRWDDLSVSSSKHKVIPTDVFSKELDGPNLPLSTIQTILIDIIHLRRHADDREIVWLAERVSFGNDNTFPGSE